MVALGLLMASMPWLLWCHGALRTGCSRINMASGSKIFFDVFSDVPGEVVYVASGAVYENTPKHAEFLSNFHRSFAICGSS